MAKKRTATRRSYRAAPRRSRGSRRNGITIAPVAGALMGVYNGYKIYKSARTQTTADRALMVALGAQYDGATLVGINKSNALSVYGPAAAGMVIHEVVGKSTGAMGTGVGLKLNRYLPKGINL